MVKTILLTPPLTPEQRMGTLAEGGAVMPGLGILYIAAFLRKEGLPVTVLDAEGLRLDIDATVDRIVREKPGVVGITATTLSIISAGEIAKAIKVRIPSAKVFLGGPHATAMPMETMRSFSAIDGCVLGDGELSFRTIVRNVHDGNEIDSGVDGLVWRNGDEILNRPKKEHLENLDTLPFPAWDLLDGFPQVYRPPFHSYRRLPVANIITTRGCPYSCSFCDRSVFGRKIHSHSIAYVIEMINYLVKDFGVKEISIKDDMFMLSTERVIEFCRQLHNRKFDLTWSCNARVDRVNDRLLREMKKAGCWMISYGIESGSPRMLKRMMKGITKRQIANALELTHRNGIMSKGFFIIGMPGETVDTLNETLEFLKTLPLDEINVNFFTPFPGTKLFKSAVKEGFKVDFERMNMLDPVYIPLGLTRDELFNYQKRIIYSFYLRFSKILHYVTRAFTSLWELKRLLRALVVFSKYAFSRIHYHDI